MPMMERLQKIIARAGVASRRHAEQLIVTGQVTVNGAVITELGSKADPERDSIKVGGKRVRVKQTRTYLLLHKPPGCVATMYDPEGRPTLRDYVRGVAGRVFPAGRLDFHASGLLLMTNDGALTNRVLKAAGRLPQTYWIKLKGRLTEEERRKAQQESGARLSLLKKAENAWYEAVLTEARRDALRKSLAGMGRAVEKVKRVKLANLELGALPAGNYRALMPEEVATLERLVAGAEGGQQARAPIRSGQGGTSLRRRARRGNGHG